MTSTSDEKRREVAQALRVLNVSDIEADGLILDDPKYVGLLLMRILDEVNDYRPGLHYFPSHFSARAVADLFADLIDRPTCKYGFMGNERFCCSECGNTVRLDFDVPVTGETPMPFKYCPNCGAVVTEKGAER